MLTIFQDKKQTNKQKPWALKFQEGIRNFKNDVGN